jgi:gamma-glutamyltranspeptidase/glutathione hydrolase
MLLRVVLNINQKFDEYRATFIKLMAQIVFKVYKVGDTIKYPTLAATLQRISERGRNEFTGETAQKTSDFLNEKEVQLKI